MPQALSLKGQRAQEAERYRKLTQKFTQEGIPAFTLPELRELEELNQKRINGELDKDASEEVLQSLAGKRIAKLQGRIEANLPPFDQTISIWEWDTGKKEYRLAGKTKPRETGGAEITWRPEWVDKPSPYRPEGSSVNRL